ncbi:MAG: hypothetical protein JSS99_08480 [Actinobacteria bacterium]|nr:hypothetical protein [Actinomycetota bacterium]
MRSTHATLDQRELTALVYELLDAHHDTAALADVPREDLAWDAHLAYLRDLQRVGRELLAHADGDQVAGD